MTPEDHLLAAAEDIATWGLCKEFFFGSTDPVDTASACALGALARTANMVDHQKSVDLAVLGMPAARRLAMQIEQEFPNCLDWAPGDPFDVISTYNDYNNTTAEDMILMMKKAAHG